MRDFFSRSWWKSIKWFIVIMIHLKTPFLWSCEDPLPLVGTRSITTTTPSSSGSRLYFSDHDP